MTRLSLPGLVGLLLVGCVHAPPTSAPAHEQDPVAADAAPDRDGDGVADDQDQCPDTAAEPATNDGCPTVKVAKFQISPPPIGFALDDEAIQANAAADLDEIATVLMSYPEISRALITCHADATEAAPQALSERRCEAVKRYLVERGVAADRLLTRAVGDTEPIALVAEGNAFVGVHLDSR